MRNPAMRRGLKLYAYAMVAASAGSAVAEQFMRYDKNPETITIFHELPCTREIPSSGKQQTQEATVFSRRTNAPVAHGCWRFGDNNLMILLKLQDGSQLTFSPLDVRQGERF
jgi:hypothetical protein